MPGPVCLCYLAPPACDPPAGSAFSSPGPPFTLSVWFLSRGFSLSRGLFCCQAAYLFCWGCSTYLHPSASWRVSFVSCDLSRVSLRHVTVILHRWDTTTSLSHFTIAWLTISFLSFLLRAFVFMAQPVRQSARIRDPAYHPRMGWSLPEIISVLSLIPFFFFPCLWELTIIFRVSCLPITAVEVMERLNGCQLQQPFLDVSWILKLSTWSVCVYCSPFFLFFFDNVLCFIVPVDQNADSLDAETSMMGEWHSWWK